MNKHLIILSTIALSASVSACDPYNANYHAKNVEHDQGNYEQILTSTDMIGTKTVKKTSRDIKTDSSGNSKTIFKSKVTEDPKGLMNKTTLSKTTGIVVEDGDKTTIYREELGNQGVGY